MNLLGNAVKFTPAAGSRHSGHLARADAAERARVCVATDRGSAFRVSDTGPGIAAEQLEQIFAPFVQAQSGHTRAQGRHGPGSHDQSSSRAADERRRHRAQQAW